MASKIYEVSIWQNDVYLDTVFVEDERYSKITYGMHRITYQGERLSEVEVDNIAKLFYELHCLARRNKDYPDLDFLTEVKKAIREYRGDWVSSMLCELKVDVYAILSETDDDMDFDDWCLAELHKRTMEERAKRRGVKTLVS